MLLSLESVCFERLLVTSFAFTKSWSVCYTSYYGKYNISDQKALKQTDYGIQNEVRIWNSNRINDWKFNLKFRIEISCLENTTKYMLSIIIWV